MERFDLTSKGSISNENGGSNLHSGCELRIRTSDGGVVSFERIVGHNLQILSCGELNCLSILQESSSDFWALGVKQDSALLVRSLLEGFSEIVKRSSMGFVVTMRKV